MAARIWARTCSFSLQSIVALVTLHCLGSQPEEIYRLRELAFC